MKFEEKTFLLKDGRECLLRSPTADDAQTMLNYLDDLAGETPYMLRYPDEVYLTLEQEKEFLGKQLEAPDQIMINAFVNGEMAGNCGMDTSRYRKCKHRATMGIGIYQKFWRLGIGEVLITELIACAKQMGFEQMELEVISDNFRAVPLYEKMGFVHYGTRPNTFKYDDGTYSDEYLMALNLKQE